MLDDHKIQANSINLMAKVIVLVKSSLLNTELML